MYVIKRLDQGGGYVTRPGSEQSYSHRLERAQAYTTREAADRNRCPGNEIVVDVEQLLDN